MPGGRKHQDDIHTASRGRCFDDRCAFLRAFSDDCLEGTYSRLDLEQHDVGSAIESDIARSPAWSRDRRLHGHAPAAVHQRQGCFDESRMCRVVDQRRCLRLDRDTNVSAKNCGRSSSNPWRNVWIALLDTTDHRSGDADGSGNRGLAHGDSQSDLPELFTEAGAGPS